DQAKGELEQAITISRSVSDVVGLSISLYAAGEIKNFQGDYAGALQLHSEGLCITREHNLLESLLYGLFVSALAQTGKGEYDGALATFQEGLPLSEKAGAEIWYHRFLNTLGWLYGELGDFDGALDLNRRSAQEARKRGDPETTANAEINLGDL